MDLGTIKALLEADSPRVNCAVHGVVAAQVTWARHGAGHTYAFDDTAAWLATHCSKSAMRDLLRIAWRTVGAIVTRVVADAEAGSDRFKNLRRIGIDEISYKRGHRHSTAVVDHDSGVLLWAHDGRDTKTLSKFFDRLGEDRCARIALVSADAAEWIAIVVKARSAHRVGIEAALTHGLSNARVESVNTNLRLLTRIAFGFRSPDALIALGMLDLGGLCPPLPGRAGA